MAKPRKRKRQPDEFYVGPHPSADRSGRFEVDALIRSAGYVIWRRTRGKEPLWMRQGRVYPQRWVLERLDEELLWNAEYQEKLYWEGLPGSVDLGAHAEP